VAPFFLHQTSVSPLCSSQSTSKEESPYLVQQCQRHPLSIPPVPKKSENRHFLMWLFLPPVNLVPPPMLAIREPRFGGNLTRCAALFLQGPLSLRNAGCAVFFFLI